MTHNYNYCRVLYGVLRKRGSPKVDIISLGSGHYCGQAGTVIVESVKINCCKWGAKVAIARVFLERIESAKEKP